MKAETKLSFLSLIISRRVFFFLICSFVFLLPFKMIFCNVLAVILLTYIFVNSVIDRKIYFHGNRLLFFVLLIPFFIQIVGIFFTDNYPNAIFSTEKRLGLVLFPLVFFFCKYQFDEADGFICLNWFIWGLSFCLIISLSGAIYNNYQLCRFECFDNKLFSDQLLQYVGIDHLTYGLYASFAINIIGYRFLRDELKRDKNILVPLVFIIIGLILLVPKMAIISTVGGLIFLTLFSTKHLNLKNISVIIFSLVIILFAIYQLPKSKERLRQFSYGFSRNNIINDPNSYSATRAGSFYCSIDLIQTYGKFGLGTGAVETEMNNWFVEHEVALLAGLDTHNQYFDYLLAFGIIGLFGFIFSLMYPFCLFQKKGFYLFSAFIVIMTLSFLTENYLNNNKGVMFFCFFNSLFASILKFKSNVIR